MIGIDVYICIDNTDEKQYLTIGKPYRVIQMCRNSFFDIYYLIKNNKGIKDWYISSRFRPRKVRNEE